MCVCVSITFLYKALQPDSVGLKEEARLPREEYTVGTQPAATTSIHHTFMKRQIINDLLKAWIVMTSGAQV